MPSNQRVARRPGGFSLVEIMVAMTIGMIGILIMMQVFQVFLGQKRTTAGAADAQENGLIAMYTMEREIRMAGLGLVGLGCTVINTYNEDRVPQDLPVSMLPVTIVQDLTRDAAGNPVAAVGTDMITLLYSTSAFASIPTTITSAMPDSSAILNVSNGEGFVQGNLFLISQPPQPCSLAQASQNGQQTGSTWNLQHNPGGAYDWNPPGGHNIFPPGGYGTGARVTNMGSMANHEYFVQNGNLMMRDLTQLNSATNPVALVSGIYAIRAQYGRDTGADGYVDVFDNTAPATIESLVALRLAVVARSGQLEINVVTPGNPPGTLALWNGGTTLNGGAITLDATAQRYRYKVYQTTIPLRNIIWGS